MANVYEIGMQKTLDGTIDLDAGSVKALLLETGATFTATHATVAAVLAVGGGEFDADSGYARQTLGTPAISIAAGKVKFTSNNVAFSNVDSADTAIAMLIFWDSGGGDGTSIPLCWCDGADEVFTDNNLKTLTYNCPSDGWMYRSNA